MKNRTHLADEAICLRGKIITGFAQVEFVMADFALKCCMRFPEYEPLWTEFPYKLESRIKAVRKVISEPGPLSGYRDDLLPLIDKILTYEDTRDLLAHGWLSVDASADPPVLHFRMYVPRTKQVLELRHLRPTLDELRSYAREITEYTHSMVLLFRKMYLEQKIEGSPPDGEGP